MTDKLEKIVEWIHRYPYLTILGFSGFWACCYPPFPMGWLGFLVLVPLFLATSILKPRQAFVAHLWGGLVYNTIMYWWIYNVMKVGPAVVVGFGLLCLILFLSLFNGLIGLSFRASLRHPLLFITFPLAWAGLEVARALGEMSFPWNNLGYVLGYWPSLIQSVSLFGIYGLSALLVACNLLIYQALQSPRGSRAPWFMAWIAVILTLIVFGKRTLSGEPPLSPSIDIALIQPAIPQTKKWEESYFKEVMAKTFRTMEGPKGNSEDIRGADLVVLAETAVPDFLRSRPDLIEKFQAKARLLNKPIIVGALDFVFDRKPWREYQFYNSAFLFTPDSGKKAEQYSKLRLVPFSEKLPFDNIFPILNYVNLGEGDFSSGDGYKIWGSTLRYAPSICYEIIYPSFVRNAKKSGAKFIVNITNDGWFGRTNGPHQHANIAKFRAVESGMPVVRCSNTGISVFYDAWGRNLGHTQLMDSTILRRKIPIHDRNTVYSRFGGRIDGFFLGALGLWILGAIGVYRWKKA